MSVHHQSDKNPGKFPEFVIQDDLDYTTPYPCHVCHQEFRSRRELATHPHPKRG